ncbi:uncharacterized protein LOC113238806 isoform X3 [Hyposmocoma kahamanoa]|uniref:uncharacterized protein LOC113238806 isoform X3 n=1 Tax=Hyposmocoma kahamanoa TaxID=1477025 RepID=UPI000E6D9E4E|nr:uncharacterized protein LOC113238806 isoform X3 [Hyposmocoma kahamanoa]XP_026331437.1 uncharacterized protein LOC113238806 isoform X3 [Hyposmocoma kahamanoa]
MRFLVAGFGLILLQCTLCITKQTEQENTICYQAKICIHNGKEKCGVSKDGTARRFFDSCDIKEYNCLNDADFAKTDINRCSQLPSIEGSVADHKKGTKLRSGSKM